LDRWLDPGSFAKGVMAHITPAVVAMSTVHVELWKNTDFGIMPPSHIERADTRRLEPKSIIISKNSILVRLFSVPFASYKPTTSRTLEFDFVHLLKEGANETAHKRNITHIE
jgi:hypothetical protein